MLLMLVMLSSLSYAKKNDEGLTNQYVIEGAGGSSESTRAVRVTIYSKKKDVSDTQLAAAAVHGVLFRSYVDKSFSGGSGSNKPSLLKPTDEKKHIDLFEPFFKNGDYMNYVSFVKDTRRVVKAGKEWKISVEVKVNQKDLKKMLSDQGIYKGLNSGW